MTDTVSICVPAVSMACWASAKAKAMPSSTARPNSAESVLWPKPKKTPCAFGLLCGVRSPDK